MFYFIPEGTELTRYPRFVSHVSHSFVCFWICFFLVFLRILPKQTLLYFPLSVCVCTGVTSQPIRKLIHPGYPCIPGQPDHSDHFDLSKELSRRWMQNPHCLLCLFCLLSQKRDCDCDRNGNSFKATITLPAKWQHYAEYQLCPCRGA